MQEKPGHSGNVDNFGTISQESQGLEHLAQSKCSLPSNVLDDLTRVLA